MDKYEYKVRAEEIKTLISEGEFAEAMKIADTIDWRRVKSVMMLCTISDLYKINRKFQESKDILLMAYERHPGGRMIVYSLCELSIKMGEFVQAIEYYKEFVQIAPKDTGRYILQYKLYEAQDVSLEERIAVLEEFKKRDYREKWAYELAYLYHRVGLETKCVEECDELVLWFGEGRYVIKALELKQLHQPLTQEQQDKYLLLKRERELLEAQMAEEAPEDEDTQEGQTEEVEENDTIADYSEYAAQEEPEDEDGEFRVKTVDVGQYNTINLQKELAESMKEILGEDYGQEQSEEAVPGPVTQSIIAPLLQDTDKIEPVTSAVNFLAPKEDFTETAASEAEETEAPEPVKLPELQTATEEVFFEDIKDVLLEDTKEINTEAINGGSIGDTKEINPKRKIIYPSGAASMPAAAPVAMNQAAAQAMPPAGMNQASIPAHSQPQPSVLTAHPTHMPQMTKPSGFEQMLSQEYDGQIRLVVPANDAVEKQITGQMNITDIMAEWERMKRENEEKRREDVRKRVQQHTGNMFSEFDEATKTGVLEQLEKAVVEAILKEAGERQIDPAKITPEKVSDIMSSVGQEAAGTEEQQAETAVISAEALPNTESTDTGPMEGNAASAEKRMPAGNAAPAEKTIPAGNTVSAENIACAEETASAEKIMPDEKTAPIEEVIDLEAISDIGIRSNDTGKLKDMVEDANRLRPLSEEEKELFGRFIHNKKTREQVIHAVDTMSMDSYTDNVIVTGEEGSGSIELAKNLIRMMQMSDSNFNGKVAKISGATLKKKNVQETLAKLTDGALIIEHATEMSSSTATDLNKALSQENIGLLVIMEGKKDEMNIFLRKNNILMDNFNARIDIVALNDQALVEYAKQYAQEQEYSIDELGILALHTRIADMQTSDHEVTVAEVRELVEDAIYFADKKNFRHFCDILFGKRYDEEDMIILREKDFMHY